MATIKAYTTIEQSRKLAVFLPLESADMFYDGVQDLYKEKVYNIPIDGSSITVRTGHIITEKGIKANLLLPCWSLAALLELLPKRIEIVDNVYELSVYLYGIYYWNINNGNLCFESKDKDNLVDACVDMIIKLHELKML